MQNTLFKLLLLLALMPFSVLSQTNFLTQQKRYERVRKAENEKQEYIQKVLSQNNLSLNNVNLLFIAYKEEGTLHIYAKTREDSSYENILTYNICAKSGRLGPKSRKGDGQVPEGFYYIDRFNPTSSYYLSLGLNYPNSADRKRAGNASSGGDIFIHGECVTIGCLPMTNEYIKEIYLLAINARNNGQQKIPVYIFPFEMTDENLNSYIQKYGKQSYIASFWKNIKIGHDKFMNNKKEVNFKIDNNGDYKF